MPDGTRCQYGATGSVILTAEDGLADTVRPRLDAASADTTRIVALEGVADRGPTIEDLDAIVAAAGQVAAGVVFVDPLMAHLPGSVNSH